MGYVFISYSTKEQSSADAMKILLEKQAIQTWMAPGDIPAGSRYAQVINKAVKECSCFILMLSESSQNSVWVAKEVERAINYRKPIIPVQLENLVLNDEFELYISTDQVVAVKKIDIESPEIQKILSSAISITKTSKNVIQNMTSLLPTDDSSELNDIDFNKQKLEEDIAEPILGIKKQGISCEENSCIARLVHDCGDMNIANKELVKIGENAGINWDEEFHKTKNIDKTSDLNCLTRRNIDFIAESEKSNIFWNLTEDGILTISGEGVMPDYYKPIPDTPWKEQNDKIKKLVIENGITVVGMQAFYNCKNIQSVIISDTVTDIRPSAFENCTSLVDVEFSKPLYFITDFHQADSATVSDLVIWFNAFQNVPWAINKYGNYITNKFGDCIYFNTKATFGKVYSTKDNTTESAFLKKQIKLTIFSPVNVDVYLNDKSNLIVTVDNNSGFNYKSCNINVGSSFKLLFVSKGFEKAIILETSENDKIEYHLESILTDNEIVSSYSRNDALYHLNFKPTGYSFEQIKYTGIKNDIQYLKLKLQNLHYPITKNTNYLIACCISAIGELSSKYGCFDELNTISNEYKNYSAKELYGYMFTDAINKIISAKVIDTMDKQLILDYSAVNELKGKCWTPGRSFTIPNEYTEISNDAFKALYGLRYLYIGESINKIYPDAFINSGRLIEQIYISKRNLYYFCQGNKLVERLTGNVIDTGTANVFEY